MGEEIQADNTRAPRAWAGEFIGRVAELEAFHQLSASGASLITVCGAPGAGKTRFVCEILSRGLLREHHSAPVFIDLSDAASGADALDLVARTLAAGSSGGRSAALEHPLVGATARYIILDTVEHLIEPLSALLIEWRAIAPQVGFVLTSREPLHLAAERIFQLDPLTPADAADLLIARAYQGVDGPGESEFGDITAKIRELVARLDYLPLAIELAAEHARTLPISEIIERLGDSFDLLRSRRRDVKGRHKSLRAALQWSWDTLGAIEKQVLAQSSVFCGGFTLKAAMRVIEARAGAGQLDVAQVLDRLVDKSLLRVASEPGAPAARYRHFHFSRAYFRAFWTTGQGFEGAASEPITEARDALHRRHASFFLKEGEAHLGLAKTCAAMTCGAWLNAEAENLRVLFERASRWPGHAERLQAARLLDEHHRCSGAVELHEELLDDAVDIAIAAGDASWQAEFLRRRGRLRGQRGQFSKAKVDYEQALALGDAGEDAEFIAWTRFESGELARQRGDIDRALAEFGRAEDLAASTEQWGLLRSVLAHQASCDVDRGDFARARQRINRLHAISETDDLRAEADLYRRLAYVHYYLGEFVEQQQLNEHALELARRLGDRRQLAACAQGLADSYFADSNFDKAIALYRDALEIHRELGDEHLEGILLGNLGGAYHRREDFDAAQEAYRRSLRIHRGSRATPYLAVTTSALGVLEHEQSRVAQARAHYAQACELFELLDQASDVASVLLYRGWLSLEVGSQASAEGYFERAQELFGRNEADVGWQAVAGASLAVLRAMQAKPQAYTGLLERAHLRVRAFPDSLERSLVNGLTLLVRALVAQDGAGFGEDLCAAWAQDNSLRLRSLHARLIQRLMRRLPEVLGAESGLQEISSAHATVAPALAEAVATIHADGSGFEVPGFEPADLRRRRSLRLILAELARRHQRDDTEGFGVFDAFDVGWPGEAVEPEVAAGRVYWAIRTLRGLGLEDYLVTVDDGYMLASSSRILIK